MLARRRWMIGLLGAVVLLVVAPPVAHAFLLTGTWSGTLRCVERTPTVARNRATVEAVLEISQTGNAPGMRLTAGALVRDYAGVAVFDVRKPDVVGDASFAACGTGDVLTGVNFNEIVRFKVVADVAKGKGKLQGESTYAVDGTVGSCKWRFKWTSIVDPGVPTACP